MKKIGAIVAKLGVYVWGAALPHPHPPDTHKVSRPLQQIGLRILSFQTGSHFLQPGSKLNKLKKKNNGIEKQHSVVIASMKLFMHCSWRVDYRIKALEGKVCKSRSCCPQFHPQLPASLQPGTKLARTPPPHIPPHPPLAPNPLPPQASLSPQPPYCVKATSPARDSCNAHNPFPSAISLALAS